MALVLGGFIFTDYAIPEKVTQGGEQHLVTHKLIGGARVIDAMGPDDSDIPWSGRFQGPDATAKAMALDMLRKSGAQVPLIIDSQYYVVVIQKFEYDYERFYQIPYRITCTVASSTGGIIGLLTTLDSLVASDMALAGALVGSL
jgi:hypothetical protein